MVESMMVRLPDGRTIEGSVDEILRFLNSFRGGLPVISGDLSEFMLWLRGRGVSVRTIHDYVNALRKFVGRRIDEVEPSSNVQVKAVRNYARFLWEKGFISYDEYMRLRSRFRIRKNSGQRYYSIDAETIVRATYRRGITGLLLRILYYSGVRVSEAIKLLEDWDPGSEVLLPGGFISSRLVCFEKGFCRYYLGWRRGHKNCEWIYFPRFLLEEIKGNASRTISYNYVRALSNKLGFPVKLYRKHFYNICIKTTGRPDICEFIESRTGGVGREHYMLVLEFADKLYPMVLDELEKLRNRYA